MGKCIWVKSLLLIIVVAVSNLAAVAQSDANSIVTLNGGRTILHLGAQKNTVVPAETLPATVVKIYSNLGTKNMVYNGNAGNGIVGKNAGQLFPEAVANAFTPTADHVVQAVQVALGYISGTNAVEVALTEDINGNPGKALHIWRLINLPNFGECCALQTLVDKAGIPVKAKTQYWVVVAPDLDSDTYTVWDNNINNLSGTWDNNTGSGWNGESYQTLNAYAVYGK
jgi:hypothetical protein